MTRDLRNIIPTLIAHRNEARRALHAVPALEADREFNMESALRRLELDDGPVDLVVEQD
jgi:hypothetical protein